MAVTYQLRALRTYASIERLDSGEMRYRRVFDASETGALRFELSLHNKQFDEADWELRWELRLFDPWGAPLTTLVDTRPVTRDVPIVFARLGVEARRPWTEGAYRYEAWIDGAKIGEEVAYFIDGVGPQAGYVEAVDVGFFEGPEACPPPDQRGSYLSQFDIRATRLVWVTERLALKKRDYRVESVFMERLLWSTTLIVGDRAIAAAGPTRVEGLAPGPTLAADASPPGETIAEVIAEVDGLIGLTRFKDLLRTTADYQRFSALRAERGLADHGKPALHALARVGSLDLTSNALGPAGLEALAAAALDELTALRLGGNSPGARGIRALDTSPHLGRLRTLHLWHGMDPSALSTDEAQALAGCSGRLLDLTELFIALSDHASEVARHLRQRFGARLTMRRPASPSTGSGEYL